MDTPRDRTPGDRWRRAGRIVDRADPTARSLAWGLQLIGGFFAAFYVVGAWGGVLLLERDPRAIKLNLVTWALQIPVVATSYLSYALATGCSLSLWCWWPPSLGFKFHLGSMFQFTASLAAGEAGERFVGINAIALAIFAVLWRYRGARAAPSARVVKIGDADPST